MQGTSAFLERIFPPLPELESFVKGLEASGAELAGRLVDGFRHLSALVEVSEIVTQRFSLDYQLPRLIELITELLNAERATLFLHDPESGELFSRVAQGEGLTEIRVSDTDGIVGSVFSSGLTEMIADAYGDRRFNREVDRRTGYRTRDLLSVPLRNQAGQVMGVTQVLNKRSGTFTEIDVALVEAINRQAANALNQARLIEQLEQQQREERELLAVTEAIATELRLDKLLAHILKATTQLLNAERSTLFIYDPSKDELWSQVAEGMGEEADPNTGECWNRRCGIYLGRGTQRAEGLCRPAFQPGSRPNFRLPHPQHAQRADS